MLKKLSNQSMNVNESSDMSMQQQPLNPVNIQVLVRLRPPNKKESTHKIVVSARPKSITVQQSLVHGKDIQKTFSFDHVYGQHSTQRDIFDTSIAPIVSEVLEGFSCTIFAYGQTSTGKTYTMEGARDEITNKILETDAGVIPRSVAHIFKTLDSSNAEYTVKVSCLELYNEELQDLLAPEPEKIISARGTVTTDARQLKIYEDGKGTYVRGTEEVVVGDVDHVMQILDDAAKKRQIAETQLNKQSSRSHAITTITIHIRDQTPDGEEYIRTGKLNMVDLAGSENIGRSGAQNKRAKEAGMINQSLLTLGRVITALTEKCPHIPYRESKLTRLLQDSLGGRTKTCIIATVSPSVLCIEETLSTLDYANRAKSIKNKPELNVKMPKGAMIKEMVSEMEVLKQQLYLQRTKQGGVWISEGDFMKSEMERKDQRERIEVLNGEIVALNRTIEDARFAIDEQKQLLIDEKKLHEQTRSELQSTIATLQERERRIYDLEEQLSEKQFVLGHKETSEKQYHNDAMILWNNLRQSENDVTLLCDNIVNQRAIHGSNEESVLKCTENITNQVSHLSASLEQFKKSYEQIATNDFQSHVQNFNSASSELITDLVDRQTEQLVNEFNLTKNKIGSLVEQHLNTVKSGAEKAVEAQESFAQRVTDLVTSHNTSMEKALSNIRSEVVYQFQKGTEWMSNFVQKDVLQTSSDLVHKYGEQHASLLNEALRRVNENTASQVKVLDQYKNAFLALIAEQKNNNTQMKQTIMSRVEKIVEECVASNQDRFKNRIDEVVVRGLDHLSEQATGFKQDFTNDSEQMQKHYNQYQSDLLQRNTEYAKRLEEVYTAMSDVKDLSLKNIDESNVSLTGQSNQLLENVQGFLAENKTVLDSHSNAVKHLRLDTQLVSDKHTELFNTEIKKTREALGRLDANVINPFVTNMKDTTLSASKVFAEAYNLSRDCSNTTQSNLVNLKQNWRDNISCGTTPPRKRKRTTVDSIAAIRTYDEIARERMQQQQLSLPSSAETTDDEREEEELDQENIPASPNSVTSASSQGSTGYQKVSKKLNFDKVEKVPSATFSPRDGKRRKKMHGPAVRPTTATTATTTKRQANPVRSDSASSFR